MTGHILLIEDNEHNRYLVTYLLNARGWEVVQAAVDRVPSDGMWDDFFVRGSDDSSWECSRGSVAADFESERGAGEHS